MTSTGLLATLSLELSLDVLAYLDVRSLLALEISSTRAQRLLTDAVEARCKRLCFSTPLYSTMATYTTMAAVPETWKALYLRFSDLRAMRWTEVKAEGTSSSLRSLKTDNQEYAADLQSQHLIRSGGHYWFSVLQTSLDAVTLSNTLGTKEAIQHQIDALKESDKEKALAFLRSSLSIDVGKWEKLRGAGPSPCPRRHHSMTCLPSVLARLSVLGVDHNENNFAPIRRVLFFGGQAEGIPFEAFNDLHVLLIDGRNKQSSPAKTLTRWVRPAPDGQPPSRRCGHNATLLSDDLVLISGGSDGTTPIPRLEVFLLHVEVDGAFGRFRWSTPKITPSPGGRAMHSVYRYASNGLNLLKGGTTIDGSELTIALSILNSVAPDEVLVFGGRQIGKSNGLMDVHRLKLTSTDTSTSDQAEVHWSAPAVSGCVPCARRGHTTIALGDKLLLIGGQDAASEQLYSDVRVLDVPSLAWRLPEPLGGTGPSPRRGFKTQFFGTSLVVSSGFVHNATTAKIDQQLPDSDIHVLTFR